MSPRSRDKQAPKVVITNPARDVVVSGVVNYSVSVSDNVGVTRVEFYVAGRSIAGSPKISAPWSLVWDSRLTPDGAKALVVRAYDAAGNVGRHEISVVVRNQTAPVPKVVYPGPSVYCSERMPA
jgi:chitinase